MSIFKRKKWTHSILNVEHKRQVRTQMENESLDGGKVFTRIYWKNVREDGRRAYLSTSTIWGEWNRDDLNWIEETSGTRKNPRVN